MSRPPVIPAEKKIRIVLSIVDDSGELDSLGAWFPAIIATADGSKRLAMARRELPAIGH